MSTETGFKIPGTHLSLLLETFMCINLISRIYGKTFHADLRGALHSFLFAMLAHGSNCASAQNDAANPVTVKHQVGGLYSPEREKDLREAFAKLPMFKLIAIDYENAEVTVEYDPAKLWPGDKPDRYLENFSNALGGVTRNTFRAKPLRAKPLDKMKKVQIPVTGLDCPGCNYGAYRIISVLPGVETAIADFKTGRVTALIDPELTNQDALEAALKKAEVEIGPPGAPSEGKH